MIPPYYVEPQFRLIEGEKTSEPGLRELHPTEWDPDAVKLLKREAKRRGNRPTNLCLGRLEADAFSTFLKTIPGTEKLIDIDGLTYEGLEIQVLSEIESVLRVVEVIRNEPNTTQFPPRGPLTPMAA